MREELHEHISQLDVERFLLGEMDDGEMSRVRTAAGECDRCSARLEETRQDERAFALKPVPEEIRRAWTGSAARRTSPVTRVLAILVPVAAAAAIALVVALPGAGGQDGIPGIGDRAGEGMTRVMGAGVEARGPQLGFYVLEGGRSVLGAPGQRLSAGDRIQFWYKVARETTGVVVGIDGRGAVTAYVAGEGGSLEVFRGGRDHVAGSSVVLDDSRGPERFFLCTGLGGGAGVEDVKRAAARLVEEGADIRDVERLPIECEQASVWINKE